MSETKGYQWTPEYDEYDSGQTASAAEEFSGGESTEDISAAEPVTEPVYEEELTEEQGGEELSAEEPEAEGADADEAGSVRSRYEGLFNWDEDSAEEAAAEEAGAQEPENEAEDSGGMSPAEEAELIAQIEARKRRRRRRQLRKKRMRMLIMILIFACLVTMCGREIFRLKAENYALKKQHAELEAERDRLAKELKNVGNKDYIKDQARKQLRLLDPGELLFVFDEDQAQELTGNEGS